MECSESLIISAGFRGRTRWSILSLQLYFWFGALGWGRWLRDWGDGTNNERMRLLGAFGYIVCWDRKSDWFVNINNDIAWQSSHMLMSSFYMRWEVYFALEGADSKCDCKTVSPQPPQGARKAPSHSHFHYPSHAKTSQLFRRILLLTKWVAACADFLLFYF